MLIKRLHYEILHGRKLPDLFINVYSSIWSIVHCPTRALPEVGEKGCQQSVAARALLMEAVPLIPEQQYVRLSLNQCKPVSPTCDIMLTIE